MGTSSIFNFTTQNFTIQYWVYQGDQTTGGGSTPLARGIFQTDGWYTIFNGSDAMAFTSERSGAETFSAYTLPNTYNTWASMVMARTGTTTTALYRNGSVAASDSLAYANITTSSRHLYVGKYEGGGNNFNRNATGYLDEIRISSGALSADWILAEYNNQSAPGSFYAVGSQTPSGGGGGGVSGSQLGRIVNLAVRIH